MHKRTSFLAILLFLTIIACQPSAPKADDVQNNVSSNIEAEKQVIAPPSTETQEEPLNETAQLDLENNKIVAESGDDITKAIVDKNGTLFLYPDDIKVHRFFGYESPDLTSKRLLLISVFTNDVEENPFLCELGAFYDMEEVDATYLKKVGNFIKAEVTSNDKTKVVYFEKKWVSFEK